VQHALAVPEIAAGLRTGRSAEWTGARAPVLSCFSRTLVGKPTGVGGEQDELCDFWGIGQLDVWPLPSVVPVWH
jgi:hypothetical protein